MTREKLSSIVNKMEIIIRKAKEEELKIIQDLNAALFKEDAGPRDPFVNLNWPYEEFGTNYFKDHLVNPNKIVLVAQIDGEITGYLAGTTGEMESWRSIKRGEVQDMYVRPEYRSLGIGNKLMKEFFDWCKEKGDKKVVVHTYDSNERGINFYKKCGFKPYSRALESDLD